MDAQADRNRSAGEADAVDPNRPAGAMVDGRHARMRLADLAHTLPLPGTRRLFSQAEAGETVDTHDPFIALLVADGSLVPVEAEPAAPDPAEHGDG